MVEKSETKCTLSKNNAHPKWTWRLTLSRMNFLHSIHIRGKGREGNGAVSARGMQMAIKMVPKEPKKGTEESSSLSAEETADIVV